MKLEDAIFEVSINLDKMDLESEQRVWKSAKGERWTKISLFVNEQPDKYNNHGRVQQTISKAERDMGMKAEYVGNAKLVVLNGNNVREYTKTPEQVDVVSPSINPTATEPSLTPATDAFVNEGNNPDW